jgi:hypothetical protein
VLFGEISVYLKKFRNFPAFITLCIIDVGGIPPKAGQVFCKSFIFLVSQILSQINDHEGIQIGGHKLASQIPGFIPEAPLV